MTAQACPETNELQQFLGGRLSGRKAESLELHLLNCSECLDASRQVSSDGDLIGALCWSPDFSDDEVLSDVIERAKGLRLEGDTVKVGGTVVKEESALPEEPRSSSLSRTRDQCEIEFLAPAEESDEIGRLGGYRVLKVIGSGGMGIVFQAEDPKLQRQIVLKAIRPAIIANPTAKNRFIREARATAALDHDNIVHIYQVDEDRGVPFIAMQYLRGETLGQRVKRDQQFDQHSAVRIGRQTAAGLAVAHAHGLVHRDIKLENLWLEEGTGRIKILDFGLVLSIKEDASLTQTGLVVGTPRYMAPEQARGEAVDHRCDLFSLGAVLFHLVTGRPAFQGRTLTATLLAVAEADCPTVEELCPHIHQDLASLINRLLSKHREDRPQSATEVDRVLGVIENDLRSESESGSNHSRDARLGPTLVSPNHHPRQEQVDSLPRVAIASKRIPKSRRTLFIGAGAIAIGLCLMGWVFYSGVVFKVETAKGTLVIESTGDRFTTTAKGSRVVIKNSETGEKISIDLDATGATKTLNPGEYFVLETDGGLKTETNRFVIRSGRKEVLKANWEPASALIAAQTREPRANRRANWVSLFDGADTKGWFRLGSFRVKNGELVGSGEQLAKSREQYANFELEFEWRISRGGDAGVFYRERAAGLTAKTAGIEYQLADNDVDLNGRNIAARSGALFNVVPPEVDAMLPLGEYNTSRIVCVGRQVEHWMNGKKLLSYRLDNPAINNASSKFEFRDRGYLYLQALQGEVAFRRIAIRRLELKKRAAFMTGQWRIVGNVIENPENTKPALILFGAADLSEGDFECEVFRPHEDKAVSLIARATDLEHFYFFNAGSFKNKWNDLVACEPDSKWRPLQQVRGPSMPTNEWVKLRLRIRGEEFTAFMNGKQILRSRDDRRNRGYIGLVARGNAQFRNIKFTNPAGKILWEGLPFPIEEDNADGNK